MRIGECREKRKRSGDEEEEKKSEVDYGEERRWRMRQVKGIKRKVLDEGESKGICQWEAEK